MKFRQAFHWDMVDQHGQCMRGIAFESTCKKFHKMLQPNELYKFNNFIIRLADESYNQLDIDYEMELTPRSNVVPVTCKADRESIFAPLPKIVFAAFSTVDKKRPGDYISKLIVAIICHSMIHFMYLISDLKGTIDTIGVLAQGPQKKMTKVWERLAIVLKEEKTGEEISITLWNANATMFNGQSGQYMEIYNCLISEYSGQIQVSSNTTTTYMIQAE